MCTDSFGEIAERRVVHDLPSLSTHDTREWQMSLLSHPLSGAPQDRDTREWQMSLLGHVGQGHMGGGSTDTADSEQQHARLSQPDESLCMSAERRASGVDTHPSSMVRLGLGPVVSLPGRPDFVLPYVSLDAPDSPDLQVRRTAVWSDS